MSSLRSTTVLAVVPLAGALLMATPAHAGGGATVERGFVCAIPVSGVPLEDGAVFTTDSRKVVTPSGRAFLICRGALPEGVRAPVTGVMVGEKCGITSEIASATSRILVSPSGRLTLTCHAVGG